MTIKNSGRLSSAIVALLLMSFTLVNVSTFGAHATEVSAVTIVDSDGDAKGSTWNVESGILTATGTVSINAADIETELATSDLEISVGSLAVDSPITWSASTVLSLNSAGALAVNAKITASGATAGLELSSPATYTLNVEEGASIQLTGATPTLSINSTDFTVVNTRAQLLALTSSSTNIALGRSITLTDAITNALIEGAFTSTFDGLGNEVSGMKISATANGATNLGFFAELRGATIRNFGVTNSSIQTTSQSTDNRIRAGIIAGDVGDAAAATKTKTAYTTRISKVWTSGTVTALDTSSATPETDKQGIFFAGGIVGSFTNGTLYISDSHSSVSVGSSGTVSTNLALGGILGDANSSSIHIEIARAYSTGTIVQGEDGGTYVGNGGIIGVLMTDATSFVTNSFSWSNIIAGHPSSGGIYGYLQGGPSVTYSYTTYSKLGNGSGTLTGSQANVTPSTWTQLPAGYDPTVWRFISGALPTLFDQATPQTPLYVKVVAPTDGTYATMSYEIVDAAGGSVNLSSLDLAQPTGVAEYTISPAVPTGTFKVSYTGGLKLNGDKAPFYFLAPYTTPTSVTITSAKTAQTVTWAPTNTTATAIDGKVTPDSAATTSGDGVITYSVQNAGTTGCTISEAKPPVITVSASGDCVVRASASGTDNFASAYKDVVFTVTVTDTESGAQVVTWDPTNTTVAAGLKTITPNASATSSGNGEITYSVQDAGTSGCTISNAKPPVITFTTPGTCVVRATAASTGSYESGYKDVSFVYEESTTSLSLELDIEIGTSVSFAPVNYEMTGLKPSSQWEIVVRSTPRTIAEGVAGETGSVSGSAYLPSSLSAGWHSITFTGSDNSGGTVSTIVWFEVSKSGKLVQKQDSEPQTESTDDGNSSGGSTSEQSNDPVVEPTAEPIDEPTAETTPEPVDSPSALEKPDSESDLLKWILLPIAVLILGSLLFLIARLRSQRD